MTVRDGTHGRRQSVIIHLLRRLSRPGARLVRSAHAEGEPGYRLVRPGADEADAPGIAADCASEAVSAGLIEPAGDGWRISSAGLAWLRRHLAEGEPFRAQHAEPTVRGTGASASDPSPESPLAWLRRRKDKSGAPLIDEAQFTAGERLRHDFWLAQLGPRVTSSWSGLASSKRARRGGAGGGVELQAGVIAARRRVESALEAVGAELSGVLVDVCCHLKGLEAIEEEEGWPQRAGKIVLQLALTRLARSYGLIATPRGVAGGAPLHWGSEDYRPSI